jgi:hypothetical protein
LGLVPRPIAAVWLIVQGVESTAITSDATQRIGMDPVRA